MLPEGLSALYTLLALVAPGLLFQWLRERALPFPEDSAFREVSRVSLASLGFSWISVLVLAAASRIEPNWFVDLSEWVAGGTDYLSENLWLAAWSVTLEVAVACALAWFASVALDRRDKRDSKSPPVVYRTPWFEVFQASMPTGRVPWVVVTLNDGTRVWGKVFRYTLGQVPSEEQQIALTGPGLAVKPPGGERKDEEYWKFVLLKASEIKLIKVAESS